MNVFQNTENVLNNFFVESVEYVAYIICFPQQILYIFTRANKGEEPTQVLLQLK